MENKFKITIPKPCHEDWNAMTPEESGRFCSVCTKGVVDFTNKTSDEIQQYFIENQGQSICGRFKNEQMNKISIPIPKSVFEKQMSFHKAFLLTLFIVMGSTLFSCKNHNDDYVTGEPIVVDDTLKEENNIKGKAVYTRKDTNEISHTVGITLPSKNDSTPIKVDLDFVYPPNQLDIRPMFNKNMFEFNKYLLTNFNIPRKYKSMDLSIYVSFVVERDGNLSNVKILRNPYNELNNKLIKIINASPRWNPGEINHIKVRSSYMFPIHIASTEP